MGAMLSDICFAARRLFHDRGSTAAAILVAALGTGLNTAVFAVAYGVLVRPLPYHDARRLAVVDVSVPFDRLEEWRSELSTFEQITAYAREGLTVRGLAEPRFVPVAVVDDTFFATLGSAALAGRTFAPGDSAAVAAVVSERLARQSGAPIETLPGRSVTVGEITATVIGVMPDVFTFPPEGVDVWLPARAAPAIAFDRSRDARRFRLIGRLKQGATFPQASEDVRRARSILDPEFKSDTPARIRVESLSDALVGEARPVLLAFTAAATLVLLIACANVATILIGRTVARRREFAIRTALGASRARLFATIFSESILIALAGAALGTVLSVVAIRVFVAWAAGILPRLGDVRADWPVLGFALAIATLSSILAAAPALRSIVPGISAFRTGIGGSPVAVRVRALLAMLQIALAVLLLSAGGLLTRTIVTLLRADTGVAADGVVVSQWMLSSAMNFEAGARQRWMEHVLQRIRAIPGAIAAGAGSSLPPDNVPLVLTARLVTGTNVTETPELSLAAVTPGYLEALGTRLLQGRYFEQADERRGDLVTLLSESAARLLMPGVDPVGRQLPITLPAGMRGRGRATVLGVIADVKYSGLASAAGPAIYVLWKELPAGQLYLALRTRGDALAMAPRLRAVLRDVDPAMPVMPIRSLGDVMQRSVADRRLRALLGGSMALLAVAIALVGVAAGVGRMVLERRHELAIRSALGATPFRALRMVMADGARITAAGIATGTLATLAAGNLLRSLVFGISPHDAATLVLVALLVGAGSLVACYLPARRAAATNPLDVLRDE
jgi:putative ABC transport system permease protein